MKKLIDFFNKHKNKVNKYQATIVIFLVVTFFVGDNTLLDGINYKMKINSLHKEIDTVKKNNEEKVRQLDALQNDQESLEQFAREQYIMTKTDEELFLIVE